MITSYKKKWIVFFFIGLVILLGIILGSKENMSSHSDVDNANKYSANIKLNNKKWTKRINTVDSVRYIKTESSYINFPTSVKELKDKNSSVIKGQVLNLEQTSGVKNTAMTKVTVLVTKVISGDASLISKPIKVLVQGGITTNKDLYYGMEDKIKSNGSNIKLDDEKVMVKNEDMDIPKIGSEIITGIVRNRANTPSQEYNDYLKNNNLGGSDSYGISVPEYNLWLKDKGDSKFRINNRSIAGYNPEVSNSLYSTRSLKRDEISTEDKLNRTTEEINEQFN